MGLRCDIRDCAPGTDQRLEVSGEQFFEVALSAAQEVVELTSVWNPCPVLFRFSRLSVLLDDQYGESLTIKRRCSEQTCWSTSKDDCVGLTGHDVERRPTRRYCANRVEG